MLDDKDLLAIAQLLKPINERLEKLEVGQEELRTDTRQTRVLVEHQDHLISLIAEQYSDVAAKLERLNELDDLRGRVRTLEVVTKEHITAIKELKKA